MQQPKKLKPRSLDITFCNSPSRSCKKCATCARNLRRYIIPKGVPISIFDQNTWPHEDGCRYFIPDERNAK